MAQSRLSSTTELDFLTTALWCLTLCLSSLFTSKCCSSARWHLLLNAPPAHRWGRSNCFIRDPLILTTCLYYYFLYFTLSARLDYSQHLSLRLFSYLYAYDQAITDVLLPPIYSLLLQFKSSPGASRDMAVVQRTPRLCIYISGRWKILRMTTGGK